MELKSAFPLLLRTLTLHRRAFILFLNGLNKECCVQYAQVGENRSEYRHNSV